MKRLLLIAAGVLIMAFAFSQTRTELKPSALVKPASEFISKNFTGYSIDKVFKCLSKNTVTYEVKIVKGTEKQNLVFDKDGKFLKKDPTKTEMKATPKPAVKPVPAQDQPKKEEMNIK
jgi:hypothetical protein